MYQPPTTMLRKAVDTLGGSRTGRYLLSKTVSWYAPYFRTIGAEFTVMEPGHVEARLSDRFGVRNHIGSVHAIAMCNLAEYVAGTCIEISLDRRMRWIPQGMNVKYEKIARGNLRAVCKIDKFENLETGPVIVPVRVENEKGEQVFSAEINMYVSERKKKLIFPLQLPAFAPSQPLVRIQI